MFDRVRRKRENFMGPLPKRKPNRLAGYDYSQPGCYFVTFCVVDRLPLLRQNMPTLCRGAHCAPASGFPPLTYAGKMTNQAIRGITSHYQNITVDKYVIMPNHVHLLLCIRGSENNGRTMCAPTKNVKRSCNKIDWLFYLAKGLPRPHHPR